MSAADAGLAEAVRIIAVRLFGRGLTAYEMDDVREAFIAARPVLVAEALADVAWLRQQWEDAGALEREYAGKLAAVAALANEWDADGWRPTTEAGITMSRCGERLRAVLAKHADTIANIRAEERERVAQEIEAEFADGSAVGDEAFNDGLIRAARVARAEGRPDE